MTFKPRLDQTKCDVRKGKVHATRWWERPTREKFSEWVDIVKKYIRTHNINVNMYVCGKFVEKIEDTWDVDVILSYPKARNYTEEELIKIRDLMNYGMQLGFDRFDMLIDMAFYLPFDEAGNFWYSVDNYIRNGIIRSQVMHSFDKIIVNGEVSQNLSMENDRCVEILKGLFITSKSSPSEKHIKRVNEGIYYRKPILL